MAVTEPAMTLKTARMTLHLSVLSFAKLLRVAPRSVSRWELGQTVPPGPQRRRILERIGPMLDERTAARLAEALGFGTGVVGSGGSCAGRGGPALAAGVVRGSDPRAALDAVIREQAEGLDVPAGRLRQVIDAVLSEAERLGLSAATTRVHVAPASRG